ncbi:MAG: RIP metalloprotease RseP [Pseudomonadales bacterium]
MSVLQSALALIVTLGVLITFHELGHFLVARALGVKVLRFSVGFGTALWKHVGREGTEYVIAAFPLGGYVKMLDEREGPVPVEELGAAFNRKSPWARIAIALGGPLANLLLAVVVYWIVMITGVSGLVPFIDAVDADSPAGRAGMSGRQEVLAVDGEDTATWQSVTMALAARLGDTGEIELRVKGIEDERVAEYQIPVEDWQKDADLPDLLGSLGLEPLWPAIVGRVVPDSAAARDGVRAGDLVVAVDGDAISSWPDWVKRIEQAPETTLELGVIREGQHITLSVTPGSRANEAGETLGFLGVGPVYREIRHGPLAAIPLAVGEMVDKTVLTLDMVKKMIMGLVSTKNLSGPITIAKLAGDTARNGIEQFLSFLALLSVSLAVINLLPIPVLDGGHILFFLIEIGLGRPLPERVQIWGLQIGVFIVASIMLLALYNDLTRLF